MEAKTHQDASEIQEAAVRLTSEGSCDSLRDRLKKSALKWFPSTSNGEADTSLYITN